MIFLEIKESENKSSPLANRIRKNYRHIRKWAKRTNTDCFRIYDRDIKEYPFTIDYYAGRFCLNYFLAKWEDEPSDDRMTEVDQILSILFDVPLEDIYWKRRIQRSKYEQYEKIDDAEQFFTVYEYGTKFAINLNDYLDTGLFLDHRETRKMVASVAKAKRVLNLFAYTCAFSVQAAIKGASFTKSVDMSNTYTAWGEKNFLLNDLSLRNHEILRADCLKFLEEEREKYDIIVIDPPTISRSKKMDQMFDVQEDYIFLLSRALDLLLPEGVIFFSTNSRKFHFDVEQFSSCMIEEISHKTLPIDFHDPKIHRSWKIRI